MASAKTPKEILAMLKSEKIEAVDFRFVDFLGQWQHFTYPTVEVDEKTFSQGLGFDASSIRGWQAINESDMLIKPVADTAFIDPFFAAKTLVLICDIQDPITGGSYSRDPRNIAQKAEKYLKTLGIGDVAYFGPEAEFFIFDDIRFAQGTNFGYYYIDSDEGIWNSGREENIDESGNSHNTGYKIRNKEGYFPCPPGDSLQDIRTEMMLTLIKMGVECEKQHHEVATAGQSELGIKFAPLTICADALLKYKYGIKNVAKKYGKTVTFMPKPLFQDNGSGMHTHISIWKGGKNTFAGGEYAGLSKNALYAIGGLIKHAPSLLALCNPTTNSYRRLVPGFEAPVNLAYSARNRSAAIRIPMFSESANAKRLEFRCPDPTCNPYLAFPAILMACLDGIQNKIDPGKPLDKDIYELPPEELAKVPHTPGSLKDVLSALEKDHDYLLKGDVFTKDVIDTWIEYKTKNEVNPMALRPHPWEYHMYYDA
jgi:glutamine synthetase